MEIYGIVDEGEIVSSKELVNREEVFSHPRSQALRGNEEISSQDNQNKRRTT